ncbi:MAG: diiron oxygenase [Sciscionella sp.]|nr:diiron oxygenase [Sciscionella sp.]
MTRALKPIDRDATAARLQNSAANKFYDPDVDIDWGAPVPTDKHFHPEHRISLYGTTLWETMTPEQRIELGRHEIASIASNGIWFEVLLMQMLLKEFYDADPTTPSAQFMLTEIADECRHSTMFAKAIEHFGVPAYGPRPLVRQLAKLLPLIAHGPARYAAILVAEEILDRMQRENMDDERLQPLVRMVNRIHVLEEARHVSFARQEVLRRMAEAGPLAKAYHQFVTALVSYFIASELINPKVYAAVGIDPREARKQARGNPNFQATMLHWGERIMGFLDEAGMIAGPGKWLWRKCLLLAR